MQIEKAAERLQLEMKATMEATGLCTVRAVQSKNGDMRFLFTVSNEVPWRRVVAKFLALTNDSPEYIFVGKKLVLHEGVLMEPWVMIVDVGESGSIKEAMMNVRKLFTKAFEDVNGGPREPPSVRVPPPHEVPEKILERVTPTSEKGGRRK